MYSIVDQPDDEQFQPAIPINRNITKYDDLNSIFYPLKNKQINLVLGWPIDNPVQFQVDSQDQQGWTPYALADLVHQLMYAYYYAKDHGDDYLAEDAPAVLDDLIVIRMVGTDQTAMIIPQIEKDASVDRTDDNGSTSS